jgi:hypothetical protein
VARMNSMSSAIYVFFIHMLATTGWLVWKNMPQFAELANVHQTLDRSADLAR